MSYRDIDKTKEPAVTIISEAAKALGVPEGQWRLFERYIPIYISLMAAKKPLVPGQRNERGNWKQEIPQEPTEDILELRLILHTFAQSGFGLTFLERFVIMIEQLEDKQRRKDQGEYVEEPLDIDDTYQVSEQYAGIALDSDESWD